MNKILIVLTILTVQQQFLNVNLFNIYIEVYMYCKLRKRLKFAYPAEIIYIILTKLQQRGILTIYCI